MAPAAAGPAEAASPTAMPSSGRPRQRGLGRDMWTSEGRESGGPALGPPRRRGVTAPGSGQWRAREEHGERPAPDDGRRGAAEVHAARDVVLLVALVALERT